MIGHMWNHVEIIIIYQDNVTCIAYGLYLSLWITEM